MLMVTSRFSYRPCVRTCLRCWPFILCLAPLPAGAAAEPSAPKPLVFGFLPIVSTERLVTLFAPLVEYLLIRLQTPIRMAGMITE